MAHLRSVDARVADAAFLVAALTLFPVPAASQSGDPNCLEKPTRACVAAIAARFTKSDGHGLVRIATTLARSGQAGEAVRVGSLKSRSLKELAQVLVVLDSPHRRKALDHASRRLGKRFGLLVALALWNQGQKDKALEIARAHKSENYFKNRLVLEDRFRRHVRRGEARKAVAALSAFYTVNLSNDAPVEAASSLPFLSFSQTPPGNAAKLYPAALAALPTDPAFFVGLGNAMARQLLAQGDTTAAVAIPDRFADAWLKAGAKPLSENALEPAARLYAMAGPKKGASRLLRLQGLNPFLSLQIVAYAGDVGQIRKAVQAVKETGLRAILLALPVRGLAGAGEKIALNTLWIEFEKTYGAAGQSASVNDLAMVRATEPSLKPVLKIATAQPVSSPKRRNVVGTTAETLATLGRPGMMLALLRSDAVRSLKKRDFSGPLFEHVCRMIELAHWRQNTALSRNLARTYVERYADRLAAGGKDRHATSIADCMIVAGDLNGALKLLVEQPATLKHRTADFAALMHAVPE